MGHVLAIDGVAVCRRFLAADEAQCLRETVNEIYLHFGSGAHIADRLLGENYRRWNGIWLKPLPGYLRRERPALGIRYEECVRLIETRVRATVGPHWRFFPKRSFFRRNIGAARNVAWHIDADAAAIFKVAASVVNVWVPLDDVGDHLPSLEVVPGSHTVMRHRPLLTGDDRHRDSAFANSFGSSMTPRLRFGDALMFDQFTLHRTQNMAESGAVRTSCEFRFASPSLPTWQGMIGRLRYAGHTLAAKTWPPPRRS
jgi:hypothetical protein